MNKTDREELRKRYGYRDGTFKSRHANTIVSLLDALDEALAEKEHYELLAESRGEQLDEAERKLAEAEKPTKMSMPGERFDHAEF